MLLVYRCLAYDPAARGRRRITPSMYASRVPPLSCDAPGRRWLEVATGRDELAARREEPLVCYVVPREVLHTAAHLPQPAERPCGQRARTFLSFSERSSSAAPSPCVLQRAVLSSSSSHAESLPLAITRASCHQRAVRRDARARAGVRPRSEASATRFSLRRPSPAAGVRAGHLLPSGRGSPPEVSEGNHTDPSEGDGNHGQPKGSRRTGKAEN